MAELTDAQKVMRNDTGKSIAEAIANMSITVAGQEIEVSDTEPQSKFVDVWFQEQQQGTPVEVYTVPEINDMIAPAETSPATAGHHVGEYIICVLNGQAKLYKVIAEISAGETLTVGGNIAEHQVAVTHSGSATINASICTGGIVNLSLRNGVLVIDGYVTLAGSTPGNNAVLFSVPEAFRPSVNKLFRAFATYGGSTGFYGITLATDGQCKTSTGGNTYTGQMFFPSVTLIV